MQHIFILNTNMLVSKYRNIHFVVVLRLSCVGVAFVRRWGDQLHQRKSIILRLPIFNCFHDGADAVL